MNDSFGIDGARESRPAAARGVPEEMAREMAGPVEALIETCGAELLGLARSLVGDVGLAEDLVQETFVRAAREARPLEHPRAWARQVLLRLATDAHRRRAVRSDVTGPEPERGLDALPERAIAGPAERSSAAELEHDLRAAILELPENLRASFTARVLERMDYMAAARLLGLEPATVRTHVMHARRRLAASLARHLKETE